MKTRAFIEKFGKDLKQLWEQREEQLRRKIGLGVIKKRIEAFQSPKRAGNKKIELARSIIERARQLDATEPNSEVSEELLWDAFRFILWKDQWSKGASVVTFLKNRLEVNSIAKLISYDESEVRYELNSKPTEYVKAALAELGLELHARKPQGSRKHEQDDDF